MAAVLRGAALAHTLPCVEKESDFHRDLDPLRPGLSDSSLRDALAIAIPGAHYRPSHPSVPSAAATPTKLGKAELFAPHCSFSTKKLSSYRQPRAQQQHHSTTAAMGVQKKTRKFAQMKRVIGEPRAPNTRPAC